ncbi:MAG TPA: PilZ domain-containing protein [Vicinamibacteria bacterium]|nr:PilZ domain-containing protein [Vicinamibacteria bacterium]
MKTVLDLIRKYDELNAARNRKDPGLSPGDEERWEELKVVYDLIMFHSGLGPDRPKYPTAEEIRDSLSDESLLRVPVEAHAVVDHEGGSFDASVVNLSRGGTFLATDTLVDVGTRVTLYIAGISFDDSGDMLELQGEVIWCAKTGIPELRIRRGIGVRFIGVSGETEKKLSSLVFHTIERRISELG